MKFINIALIAAAGLAVACGKSGSDAATVTETAVPGGIADEKEAPAKERVASGNADSLALMVDDLTAEQTVFVLESFASTVKKAHEEENATKAMVTMRKYVDVYDIATGNNPEDVKRALRRDARWDYDSLATAYRNQLSNYGL